MLRSHRTIEFVQQARKRGMTEQEFALYRRTLRNKLTARQTGRATLVQEGGE